MLYINAAVETEHRNEGSEKWKSDLSSVRGRFDKYMPLDRTRLGNISGPEELGRHPDIVIWEGFYDLLEDWEYWFNMFLKDNELTEFAQLCNLKIKKENTIAEP